MHSLLIHAYRLSAFTSFRDFTEVLFGRPSDGRGWSWRFKRVGKHLDSCKVTAWALLQGTLLLPYLMPFMSPEAARIGQNRLDGGHRTGERGVRPAWHINNNRPLNYCPLCVRMHMRRFRRSMWLRCHQLDGVNACWRHAVNLIGVNQNPATPQLPHEFPDQNQVCDATCGGNKPITSRHQQPTRKTVKRHLRQKIGKVYTQLKVEPQHSWLFAVRLAALWPT